MTAEFYIQEKERLSQAMNGQDRLMEAVENITKTFAGYNLDKMPGMALDITVFTLETLHLDQSKIRDRRL